MQLLSQLEYFGKALVDIGSEREDVVVLDPDVSSSTKTTYFAERFPSRFINTGISEQDLIGIAAGLASSGKVPIATGFSMFLAGRAWEQIANMVARPKQNVKITATHGGLSPHADGGSHQLLGDVALMRVLPNMRVVVPADAAEAVEALRALVLSQGPSYLRLGRGPTPTVYEEGCDYALGMAHPVKDGSDATIIANGVMVSQALEAADCLEGEGLDVRVVDMHTVKPLDADCVVKAARETGAIVTSEEHSVIGGLGGAVSEILAEEKPTPMRRVGVSDSFGESSRTYEELLEKHGLSPEAIAMAVRNVMGERR